MATWSGYVTRVIREKIFVEVEAEDAEQAEQRAHDVAYDSRIKDWREIDCEYTFDLEQE